MSLATLGRKSRTTNPRYRRDRCFILNMTGRGNVIGQNFNAGNCRGKKPFYGKCRMGALTTCCAANHLAPKDCHKGCGCWHKGLSQPAPQMGYGIYLNRKSGGAYRTGASDQCCSTAALADLSRNRITWKQSISYDASTIIDTKRGAALRCSYQIYDVSSGKITAKLPDCVTNGSGARGAYDNCCKCDCRWPIVKPRLSYPRINHHWCGTTKTLCVSHTAGEQIAMVKAGTQKCGINPITKQLVPQGPYPNSYTLLKPFNKSRCKNPYGLQ